MPCLWQRIAHHINRNHIIYGCHGTGVVQYRRAQSGMDDELNGEDHLEGIQGFSKGNTILEWSGSSYMGVL